MGVSRRCLSRLILLFSPVAVVAGTVTLDFEGFPDSTILSSQYPGVTFSNAIVLTTGISLNEFEFPPHSGTNVASDNGGPMYIMFSSAIQSFSGFFTYSEPLTIDAFGTGNTLLTSAHSAFSNNEALSGVAGSAPNEFLQASSANGISSITITGDMAGGSFALDDAAYSTATTTVPEPRTVSVAGFGLLLVVVLMWRRALSRKLCAILLLGFLAAAGSPLAAAPVLGASDISQTVLVVDTPTVLTITVAIDDPSLIANSVNLLRVIPGGQSVILGRLHDDGKNGDLVAGDKIYTIKAPFNETTFGQFQLQISAAFKGILTRTLLTLPTVFVQPSKAPQQALTGLMTELQTGNLTAALKRFAPSQSTTSVLTNITTSGKTALITALATATLVMSTGDLRFYTAQWPEQDGTTTPVEFSMAPDPSGQWVIVSW